jgi:DNA polymerase-3 subunit delta'
MSLKEIFSQDRAISILQRALASERVPHAYIFAGLGGVGKFTTALAWAKLLLCDSPLTDNNFADACGSCPSCQSFAAASHPDFAHVYKELIQFTKDGKNKKTPIDLPIAVIREFLIEKVSIRPTLSKRKVFIVSESEKLNISSQNALLKTLEEPASFCHIILITSRSEKFLPTIRSRCQTIGFGPIDEKMIQSSLDSFDIAPPAAKFFAKLSYGSLGAAHDWAKLQAEGADLYNIKRLVLGSLASLTLPGSLTAAETIQKEVKKLADVWAKLEEQTSKTDISRRAQKTIIQIIISALRDVMLLQTTQTDQLTNSDQPDQLRSIARRLDAESAAEKITAAARSMQWIDANVNQKLIFEHLLLNLGISDTIKV